MLNIFEIVFTFFNSLFIIQNNEILGAFNLTKYNFSMHAKITNKNVIYTSVM